MDIYTQQGNKQLFLESMPIVGDSVSFFLTQDFPVGYYRFTSGPAMIDLILSNENVTVKADLFAPEKGIEVIQSQENQQLYNFYRAYSETTADSAISCDQVASLRSHYTVNNATPLASQSIAFFLSSMNCDSVKPRLNPFLNSAPFSFEILQNLVAKEVSEANNTNIVDELIACSDSSKEVRHSIYLAAYEAALYNNFPNVLSYLLQQPINSPTKLSSLSRARSNRDYVHIGDAFPIIDVVDGYKDKGASLIYVVITDPNSNKNIEGVDRLKVYFSNMQEEYFIVEASTISELTQANIGYYGGNMVFMLGKGQILADKWIGNQDLLNLK